jgi:hypothetical protein
VIGRTHPEVLYLATGGFITKATRTVSFTGPLSGASPKQLNFRSGHVSLPCISVLTEIMRYLSLRECPVGSTTQSKDFAYAMHELSRLGKLVVLLSFSVVFEGIPEIEAVCGFPRRIILTKE